MKRSKKAPGFIEKLRAFIADKRKKAASRKGLRFILCPNFIIYFAVLIFALIFTQALRSPLSGVLYVTMLILPFVCLIHLMLSLFFINAAAES